MKFLGLLLFIIGLASILIAFFGGQHLLLMWVDNWGTTAGWVIRIAVTVIGLLLYLANRHKE